MERNKGNDWFAVLVWLAMMLLVAWFLTGLLASSAVP